MLSVQKVFEYENTKNNSSLYLHAPCSENPEIVLKLYVDWYNSDFAPKEQLEPVNFYDFKFICSFCPINFYDDYMEEKKNVK